VEAVNESQVQDGIVDALTRVGIWAFRVRAEAKIRGIPAAPPGTADIWTELGWCEIKMRGRHLSHKQIEWHDKARRRGVRACVVYEDERGPKELIIRAAKTILRWRTELPAHRGCPHERCPMEDHS
jgi:hypothetical protein